MRNPGFAGKRAGEGYSLRIMADNIPLQEKHRAAWLRQAGQFAMKHNLALWLDRFVPWATGFSVLMVLVILGLRTFRVPVEYALAGYAVVLGILGVGFALALKNVFSSRMDGLVHLDYRLRLHNRLTSAYSGVGPWPARPREVNDGSAWRWGRILLPLAAGAAFVILAVQLPVTFPEFQQNRPQSEPLAWSQTDDWLETLEEEQIVEQETLEQFQEKIESLREQSPDQWFEHGSLEAGESLRDNLEKGMFDLQTYLESARELLESAEAGQGQLTESTLEKMNAQYEEALKGLQNGITPLNKELMSQLRKMDLSQMNSLDPQQLQQMMEKMGQCEGGLGQCLGNKSGQDGMPTLADYLGGKAGKQGLPVLAGESMKPGMGGYGEGDGSNGQISRGPGSVPLRLGEESDLGTQNTEGIQSHDYSNAIMGDLLGENATDPESEIEEYGGLQQAGAVQSTGEGGEAVWRDTLSAEERQLLQRYFQ